MSRGVTLSNARAILKTLVGDAQETNTYADDDYNRWMLLEQSNLANAYDWPFLRREWNLSVAAADRWKNIPTTDTRAASVTINFARPVLVERKYNDFWNPIGFGIGSEQYNAYDSDANEASDPIQRWQMVTNSGETTNADQIEVWPIPTTAQTLRFTGQRNVLTTNSDSSKLDLDDLLVCLFVAANRLFLRDQKNATLMLKRAEKHLLKLRAGYPTKDVCVKFGQASTYETPNRRNVPLVIVAP